MKNLAADLCKNYSETYSRLPEAWEKARVLDKYFFWGGDTLVVKAFRALVCTRKFRKPHACPKNMRQSGEVAQ